MALTADPKFWADYPRLWVRMNVVLVDLYDLRDYVEQELRPAARPFEAARPAGFLNG